MSNHKFDWFRILLLALAVAALLVSVVLVRMSAGQPVPEILSWACGEPTSAGRTDCDKALYSDFSTFNAIPPRPIPTATLGMAYYTAMGVWLLFVGRLPGKLHRFWLIPGIMGVFGLLSSAFFVYIMYFKINAPCGLCMITHGLNLPLVLGIWGLWLVGPARQPVSPTDGAESIWPVKEHLWKIPALALVVGAAVGIAQFRDAQTTSAMQALDVEAARLDQALYANAKVADIPIDEDDPILGPANAPHTVVIFSDFQCPACAQTGLILGEVQKRLAARQYARKAGRSAGDQEAALRAAAAMPTEQLLTHAPFRIVFKHWPLNKTCNEYWRPLVPMEDHKYACDAAIAAEAARTLGGSAAFWRMHDLIYTNRTKLALAPYTAFAEQIGLDAEAFEETCREPGVMERIRRDMRQASEAGVLATPTVFLDNRRVERTVRQGMGDTVEKTTEMWGRLVTQAAVLNRSSGTRVTGTMPATGPAPTAIP